MVGQNPPHTYRKDDVFYYCRRIPKDLLSRYDETRIVMYLRTKSSKTAAGDYSPIDGCNPFNSALQSIPGLLLKHMPQRELERTEAEFSIRFLQ